MKKYCFLASMVLMCIILASCKKYLDAKSNARLVTPQSLKDIQGILDDAELMNLSTTPSFGESSGDDSFLLPEAYSSYFVAFQNIYRWVPIELKFGNDWSQGYLAIYNANLSLDLLTKVERSTSNAPAWDNIQGSALFFRAYYLLGLCSTYAKVYNEQTADHDLGVVLRLTSDFNIPSVRSSVKECYAQIIKDITQSIDLLPTYPQHVMRPSKGAALALLARTYLYMGKYELARNYVSEALKINSTLMDYNGDAFINNLAADVPFKRFNPETIFYSEMGSYTLVHTPDRSRIDTSLVLTYAPADLRKVAYFNNVSGYQQYKGSYASNFYINFSGLATDELYLTRAECNAFLGQLDQGLEDINFLLKKRWDKTKIFIPISAKSKSDLLAKVRLERRKELLLRGLRWMDIKRYNREGEQISLYRKIDNTLITLKPNDPYYALPIPTDVIEQSGIPQN